MNKTEFLQGLGIVSPESEPEEIRIEGKHAKRVAPQNVPNNPAPAPKKNNPRNPNSNKELAALNAKVAVLEERSKQDGSVLTKVLDALENGKAELEQNQAELKATTEELEATNNRLCLIEKSWVAFEEATAKLIDGLRAKIAELVKWKDDKVAEEAKAEAQANPKNKTVDLVHWLFTEEQ